MPPYPALLIVHLVAVMAFVGGLFLAGLTMPLDGGRDPAGQAELRRLRRWNAWVTTPALLVVWGAGTAMAAEAGWFATGWLQIKLFCVLLLTLLHGLQSWRLHAGRGRTRLPMAAAALLVIAIVYLVGAKP